MQRDIKHELELYRRMRLIRRAEEKIVEHYGEDEMKTPVHLYIGQEAVAVGVCDALHPDDGVVGTYRSHGVYLARSEDVEGMFAELYGRTTGPGKGKAGSMHLAKPSAGLLMTSAVVGTTIPLALGIAFANRRKQNGRVGVAFFGDGATNEGVFWESVNFAAARRMPVLFVCEDNGLAIHSRREHRQGYRSISEVMRGFDFHVAHSDSTDPWEISKLTREMLARQREDGLPVFLHLECYRYVEHVGIREDRDFHLGYRRSEEFEHWWSRDPVNSARERLLESGVSADDLRALEARIEERLTRAVALARSAPLPTLDALWEDA